MAEYTINQLCVERYDALLLTGVCGDAFPFSDLAIVKEKVREFDRKKKVIAAISAGPMILLKAGILKERPFMCGCPRWGLLEENIPLEDMMYMKDGEECQKDETLIYIQSDHIITSVAWHYREWAMQIAEMLGIKQYRGTFGLPSKEKKDL